MQMTIRTVKTCCSVCGVDDSVWQFSAVDRLHGIPGRYQYVQCRRCDTLYANPRVADEHLGRVYPADYEPHRAAPAAAAAARPPGKHPWVRLLAERVGYHLR